MLPRPSAIVLKSGKAALGVRNTALFAHTPGVRAPLSSTQRASFSVRRDPSTYSPAAFTERWNDVPRGTMGARSHASRLAGAVCFRPPMKQASRSKEESFRISFEVMLAFRFSGQQGYRGSHYHRSDELRSPFLRR